MLEIEMKFRVDDVDSYERLLAESLGVVFGEPSTEADVFFTNQALGFPNEGKSLRIRRRGNYLAATFKGPRLDKETKTREEIELTLIDEREEINEENAKRVDDAKENWIRFYQKLGFAIYGEVVKTRRRVETSYDGRPLEITLDKIEGLGYFTELEIVAEKDNFEEAKAILMILASRLGLKNTIARSYLSMVYEKDRFVCECDRK